MNVHCFAVRVVQPEPAQTELNQFRSSRRVVSLQREFAADGADSYGAFCLEVAEDPGPLPGALRAHSHSSGRAAGESTAPDCKKILNEADFALFASLRELLKHLTQRDGFPVYTVFTNEQLAAPAVACSLSLNEVAQIDGLSEARMRKCGNDWNDNGFRLLLSSWARAVAVRTSQRPDLRGRACNTRCVDKPQGPLGAVRAAVGGSAPNAPWVFCQGVAAW